MESTTIAVIGSRSIGNGIAQLATTAGFQVNMQDVAPEALEPALRLIRHSLGRLETKCKLQEAKPDEILDRIHPMESIKSAVSGADYVIEAVPENLDLKCQVFHEIDRLATKYAIVASNTSQYSITQLAAAPDRPAQVIETHFFNPPVIMRLIEAVRGLETSRDALEITLDLTARMGKEVVG